MVNSAESGVPCINGQSPHSSRPTECDTSLTIHFINPDSELKTLSP